MDISILIATYRRAQSLKRVLENFVNLKTSSLSWEILIADNADDLEARSTVRLFEDRLPVRCFIEHKKGKNAALNRILPEAKGDIFVFTDDDIAADKDWLTEILEGIKRWPEYSIFGGRILPYNSKIIPDEFKCFSSYPYLYGVADWSIQEGEYDSIKVFGPNMIVRSDIFAKGHCFCESVGPSGNNYITGSESEFLLRMHDKGYKAVYLPKALVYHYIRPEQTSLAWILGRGFRGGRSTAWFERDFKGPRIFGIPRFLYRLMLEKVFRYLWKFILMGEKENRYQERYDLEVLKGKFYQYYRMSRAGGDKIEKQN